MAVAFSACEKDSDDESNAPDQLYGRYKGTFHRTGTDSSEVNIFFKSDGKYEGSSSERNYPAICGGSFNLDGNRIEFTDSCSWTADFDWTLILDGNYTISTTGDNRIRIWRTSNNLTDEYNLTLLTR